MLRRYLVINGITTAALYAAASAFVPHFSGFANGFQQSFDAYAMDSALLGPLVHRVVLVFSSCL